MTEIRLTGVFFLGAEELLDLVANLSIRNLDVIFGCAVIGHERKKIIISDIQLESCQ